MLQIPYHAFNYDFIKFLFTEITPVGILATCSFHNEVSGRFYNLPLFRNILLLPLPW